MNLAYESDRGFYRVGKTLYVAGTDFRHRPFEDVMADAAIPFHMLNKTRRYAELRDLILQHQPTHLIGHSLGGSLALEAQREFPQLQVDTYGAPVLSLTPDPHRHANWGDPIALFDLGASHQLPRSL
jgi:pimeloyl-ACP methyl ester carboxylesterase